MLPVTSIVAIPTFPGCRHAKREIRLKEGELLYSMDYVFCHNSTMYTENQIFSCLPCNACSMTQPTLRWKVERSHLGSSTRKGPFSGLNYIAYGRNLTS